MRRHMRRHIIIIIFCSILLILAGYGLFTEVLKEKKTINKDFLVRKEYTKEDFDKIVSDRLGLAVLLNKKSLNEMTNQERLRMLIHLYDGDDKYETFSQAKLDVIHSGSIIKNLDITYEDLKDYYGTFTWNNSLVGYKYDSNKKTFTYTGNLGHGGYTNANIAHSEMLSLDTDGIIYAIKYRYVFYNTMGDGPSDVKLYLNIDDALNGKNELTHLKVLKDNSTHMDEYLDKHYDEIKDKLPIYSYVFKVENNHLVITDFLVDSK